MMSEFIYMGGYSFYIWSSYSLALIILVLNILGPSLKHKKSVQQASDIHLLNGMKSDES